MHLSDLDFDLPDDQIALHPATQRDASRLLVLECRSERFTDTCFADLTDWLHPQDVLVLNETRVVPARLHAIKESTGGRVELLVVGRGPGQGWLAMARPLRGLKAGEALIVGDRLRLEVIGRTPEDRLHFRLADEDPGGDPTGLEGGLRDLARDGSQDEDPGGDPTGLATFQHLTGGLGEIPLPPYIRRSPVDEDRLRYQTVYARRRGSIAAPTAGLHFTEPLLAAIVAQGTAVVRLLLHVGAGTFAPVRHQDLRRHRIEAEYYDLPPAAVETILRRRHAGGRVIAVGTTCVRALETCAGRGHLEPGRGWTRLVITPGHRFRAVDAMVTNFHLPGSSLLMLVAAFAGLDAIRRSYEHAVRAGYRFYSYGDAMFIHGRTA